MSEEKVAIDEVTVAIMQMVQHFTNHINYEMLRILCDTGYCKDFVNMCMICKEKERVALEAQQTKLDDFSEEE